MKTLYTNAKIYTADIHTPFVESMLVEDEKILWTGPACELPSELLCDKIEDMHGRCILPGFTDAHMHPVMLADFSEKISALPPKINSIKELIREIQSVRSCQTAGQWIEGWGYDEGKLAEHRSPNRYDLDKGCSDSPVSIIRTCGHIRCVNSKALELAGIDRNTPDPEGGEIERDASGEPTGVLKENARSLISDIMPPVSEEKAVQQLCSLGQLLLSQGIIAVSDMGNLTSEDIYSLYQKAAAKGFLQQVAVYYFSEHFVHQKDFRLTKEMTKKDKQIRIAGMKLIGDGSVSGHTAWMEKPYLNSDDYGLSVCSDALLEWTIKTCRENSCQLAVHAMGGQTIRRMVDRLAQEENWMKDDTPYVRLEHTTEPSEDSVNKAVSKGMAFVTQPIFLYAEIESYLKNLGQERTKSAYPIRHLLDKGVPLAFSTDAPATSWAVPSNPFVNIKAAVTRTAYDGTDCGRQQAVDVETAIRLYTKESAKVCGFTHIGRLSPGYMANFILLDRDIFTIAPEEIDQVQVLSTYIKGQNVYQAAL